MQDRTTRGKLEPEPVWEGEAQVAVAVRNMHWRSRGDGAAGGAAVTRFRKEDCLPSASSFSAYLCLFQNKNLTMTDHQNALEEREGGKPGTERIVTKEQRLAGACQADFWANGQQRPKEEVRPELQAEIWICAVDGCHLSPWVAHRPKMDRPSWQEVGRKR